MILYKNIAGQTFGKLKVISLSEHRTKGGTARWNCLCDCGNTCVVIGSHLRIKKTKSCGCSRYERALRPATERFWKRVGVVTRVMDCWPWLGAKDKKGYGRINMGNKTWKGTHVFAYEDVIGPVQKGLHLHHECENPNCVNPFHLIPLTRFEHHFLHRKPGSDRRLPTEDNPTISCGCGCGETLKRFDGDNRPREFIRGHSGRRMHCVNGHSLSGENLYKRPGSGKTVCGACLKLRNKKNWREMIGKGRAPSGASSGTERSS